MSYIKLSKIYKDQVKSDIKDVSEAIKTVKCQLEHQCKGHKIGSKTVKNLKDKLTILNNNLSKLKTNGLEYGTPLQFDPSEVAKLWVEVESKGCENTYFYYMHHEYFHGGKVFIGYYKH